MPTAKLHADASILLLPFLLGYKSHAQIPTITLMQRSTLFMQSLDELGERFLKKFRAFNPVILLREEAALVLSFQVHEIFRVWRKPIFLLVSTYESIERAFAADPDWLDGHININPSVRADHELILFALAPPGNEPRARNLLATQVLACEQAIIPFSSFFERGKAAVDSLRDTVVSYVPVRRYSPYRIDKIASPGMFYGRQRLLNRLLSGRGTQVIVGPRRIGKSSLARYLEKMLGTIERFNDTKGPMMRCSYTDVSELGEDASERIWHSILLHFNLNRRDFSAGGRIAKLVGSARRYDQFEAIDEAQALGNVIRSFPGQLTIILDELDNWIEAEATRGWPTLGRLRAMTDEGRAQVLLVGYETLSLAADNDRFPFAGRGGRERLDPLTTHEVERLVVEPMLELGLRFTRQREILNLIWKTTSGMPHIVQDICSQIVDLAMSEEGPRVVTLAITKAAIESAATVRTFRHGLMNCSVPLAEAIAGVLSISKEIASAESKGNTAVKAPMTVDEIAVELEQEGYIYNSNDFELALAYLELRLILKATDPARTRWEWTNALARDTMRETIVNRGAKRWFRSVLDRHREGSWRRRYDVLQDSSS